MLQKAKQAAQDPGYFLGVAAQLPCEMDVQLIIALDLTVLADEKPTAPKIL